MNITPASLVFIVLGSIAALLLLRKLQLRLELSSAKHRSLAGHARWSRRLAKLVPFYEFDEAEFFTADDAPREIATGAARRLHAPRGSLRAAFREDGGRVGRDRTRRVGRAVHGALSRAVPVQRLRAAASEGRQFPAVLERRHGHRSRRQPALRSHRLVRRECLRLRLLQGLHRARRAPGRGSRAGARRLPPRARLQREAAAGDLGPRRSVVSHVGHRSRDAGRAARRATTRAARTWFASAAPITAGGATCSRAWAIRSPRAKPTRSRT